MFRLELARPIGAQLPRFAWIWLTVGFATGTATLLGPVRWITDVARGSGWQPGAEDLTVRAIILVYVVLSFVVSVWIAALGSSARPWRWGVPALTTALAVGALGLWMSPTLINAVVATPVTDVSAHFTFGPYPERERFEQLTADGYTGVVSLLHPAVVPFEPALLARERKLAEEFGIELIHAPMLPWVSENAESLALIGALADRGSGRYYVHCYLGRDRVGMVRRLIQARLGEPRVATVGAVAEAPALRELRDPDAGGAMRFERGRIFELDDGVFLGPYPTDEEFARYVIGEGGFAHLMSLLDPSHDDDRQWVDAERELAETYALGYTEIPVDWRPYDGQALLRAVETARSLPRPLLVHAFRSDVGVARAFRRAWESGRAGVREDLFTTALERGEARLLTVALVVGPRPRGPEFGTRLQVAGVTDVLFVGPRTIEAVEDRRIVTSETDLRWHQAEELDDATVASVLREGGWYVYGLDHEPIAAELEARLGARATAAAAAADRRP